MSWYRKNRRQLPWRQTDDPYRIWISEVMLQQTRVETVVSYYERFLTAFPTVADLARTDQQKVLRVWEGLGYYARARNLHRAAGIVVDRFGGRLPDDPDDFRSLPGVGAYIAAAVLSIAFGKPFAVVDGNVKRVLARLLMIETPVNGPGAGSVFQAQAQRLLYRPDPGAFNQALMELGALVCIPRSPACGRCPLAGFCAARQSDSVAAFPVRNKKMPVPEYAIAVGVVYKNGRVLITRRKPDGLLGGLWEFPGGKIRKGESAEAACQREISEEVGLTVTVEERIARVRHAYTHFKIVMDVFCCQYEKGKVVLNGPVDFSWVIPRRLDDYPFPKANRKFIPMLLEDDALRRYSAILEGEQPLKD
ncbi:MAG: A/G-specific adenine glycosylase [Desulfobacterales bacterium]|nr:A/G-specific adenine glycosylase [Desulfobacterales bacterium]